MIRLVAVYNRFSAKVRRWRNSQAGAFWLFVSPWLIGFIVFTLGPLLASLYISFTKYNIVGSPVFAGLDNYRELVNDPLVLKSLVNTLIYVVSGVPLRMVLALALAMLLNRPMRGVGIFRTAYYMPSLIPSVTVSLVWLLMFNYRHGILNGLLEFIHLPRIQWLTSGPAAMSGLVLVSFWTVGTSMLIFLAALQGIPNEVYEAAVIDGANRVKLFRYITVPLMTPALIFSLIMNLIYGLQVFTEAYVITRGGPLNATLFYVLYLYRHAFQFLHMGFASAMAWVLFIVTLISTTFVLYLSKRWSYEM